MSGDPRSCAVTLHATTVAIARQAATVGPLDQDATEGRGSAMPAPQSPDLPPQTPEMVAVTLIGPSGSGKSSLALELIARGARLVSDDLTTFTGSAQGVMARFPSDAPPNLHGQIEARGVGLIRVPTVPMARVMLVVDLAQVETERLPPARGVKILANQPVDVIWKVDAPHFPSAIFNLVTYGQPRATSRQDCETADE